MAAPRTDQRLAGRYELGELLGRGGMGEVRAATDHRLGRPVAVKLLRADLAGDAEVRARFEAEGRAAARLSHPNVVAVYDTGEDDGQPFIVMERLPGETLADEIAKAPLSAGRSRRVGAQVLAALQVAHDAGIVHRDVKPGNVLFAEDGIWKVGDFGIAKSTEAVADLTATGGLVGTPAYLAPERLDGQPATPASDLYSIGVVLYEALAGRRPFEADVPVAMARMIRDDEPPPLRERCPDLERGLADVVERAMSKDPARRFATAAEMRTALAGAAPATLPSAPARAVTPTQGTRVLPFPPRARRRIPPRWIAAAVVAAAVLFLVLGLAIAIASRSDPGRTSVPTPTSPTPSTAADAGGAVPGAPLPATLDDALEQLEKSVRP